ncbi:DUF2971 domain-containing protein [Leclercia sp. S52]|uniref:DUF2971 domain-containing protein n=1 Tax=Leclercia sp. S52 TaxID=3138178 RepID=UPI00321AE98C
MNKVIPRILYKYRAFSLYSLDSLINDTVYLADPVSFNDPFDCQPSIIDDLSDIKKLREIAAQLMFDTQARELKALRTPVMKYLNYQGDKIKHPQPISLGLTLSNPVSLGLIFREDELLGKHNTQNTKTKHEYNKFEDAQIEELKNKIDIFLEHIEDSLTPKMSHVAIGIYEDLIKSELLTSRNIGVLSLARDNDCQLMWAHYSDDHQGFCCGYRLPGEPEGFASENKIKAVDYDGIRTVSTSQLHELVNNSSSVKAIVNNAIYYVKSKKWEYENEYRMIGKPGLQQSPFILESVSFGLRCKDTVKFSIMSALSNRTSPVKFFQMEEVKGTFDLIPKEITLANVSGLPVTSIE